MQKFVLFLGHPIYALAVVLATLLAASGSGSALSGWGTVRWGVRRFVSGVAVALALVLAMYALALGPLFHALLGLPLPARVLMAVLLVALPGTLMGTLLPTGVRVAGEVGPDLVALSMNFGFTASLAIGIACYLGAMLLLPRQRIQSQLP